MEYSSIKDLLEQARAQGRLQELQPFFEQGGTWQMLFDLTDENLEIQFELGRAYLLDGKLDEATAAFTSLTILNPYKAEYWFSLGVTQNRSGAPTEALQAYLLASAVDPRNPLIRLEAAKACAEIPNIAGACELAHEALALAENHPEYGFASAEISAFIHRLAERGV